MNLTEHNKKVKRLRREVRSFYKRQDKIKIYHGGTNSTRKSSGKLNYVSTVNLDQVITVNTHEKWVLVEPNVALDQLALITLKHGLLPPVISEFPGITVAGAIQGGAGESSSFRWGCFDETCLEYEIVLGDGGLLTASSKSNADLFNGVAGSYGSLGIMTLIKLKLIPATQNIKLTYIKVSGFKEAVKLIEKKTAEQIDFVDGIMFSETEGVVMVGYYENSPDLPKSTFHRFTDEWFYMHAQKIVKRHEYYEESIPTPDYLFRYDRGAFWTARDGFKVLKAPFNRLTRIIFAPLFTTRNLYRFLHGSGLSQRFLIQDLCMPAGNTVKFAEFVDKNFAIYPLWFCPLKPATSARFSPTFLKTDLVINVGVWGLISEDPKKAVDQNKLLEKEVKLLGGRKVLYSHAYYSEKTFWNIYDKALYEKLRKKYNAETTLRDIYQKVFVSDIYQISILNGWKAFIKSPFK